MSEATDLELETSEAEVTELADNENRFLPYEPKSKAPFKLDTLTPRNLGAEVRKALNKVVKIHGNIDQYVLQHLKYPTTEAMWKGLAAEQVDSLGLYLHQFDKGQGIIIGDKTGIGKGRQAAAVIRHAIVNGYLPVFFTRKDNLFTDIYRDLVNIGHADIRPFILNTGSEAHVKDQEGNVVFSPLGADEQREALSTTRTVPTDSEEAIRYFKSINKPLPDPEQEPTVTITDTRDDMPRDYDCVFTTYSQIQAAAPYKRLWLAQLVAAGVEGSKKHPKVVFILDESHMAGGFDSIIGKWMRSVLPFTKSCCYLSATFAKNPDAMPFYAKKTAIAEASMGDDRFVSAMKSGGLALQEIVASNLAESGQLIRRERSNEGYRIEYITLDKEPERTLNRQKVNRIIKLMADIVGFEQEHIVPILDDQHDRAKAQGEHMDARPKNLGVKKAPYFSRVFGIVDQMLFALMAEDVARQTIEFLMENKKVVIAFKSTMGAFLKDLNLVSGDVIQREDLDFALTLKRGLDGVFSYNYTDIDGNKTREHISLEELSTSGLKRYNEIVQLIDDERSGLTVSPIDQLRKIIEETQKPAHLGGHDGARFTVAEVTGRNQRLQINDDGSATVVAFRSNTEKSFRLFNSGDYDVLLINQSGSTGSSAHASAEFKDQRIRAMIIHQLELDVTTEMQKRGRIDRTGQVELPEYYYMVADIPIMTRLMTMLKSKLKALDANTTGSQKTSDKTLESVDFLNKYGDIVAWDWINDNPELTLRMGRPTYHKEEKKGVVSWVRNDSKDGAIRQLTGRAGLLYVEEQDKLYDELMARYEAEIKHQKQRGTYDLETEFLQLDGVVKERHLYQVGNGGASPFGKNTVRDITIVNNLTRPFAKDELDERMIAALQGKKPAQVQAALLREVEEQYPMLVEAREASKKEVIDALKEELEDLPEAGSKDTEKENDKLERERSRLQELIVRKQTALQEMLDELDSVKQEIVKYLNLWQIGDIVKVAVPGMMKKAWGVFLGFHFKKANNPYTLGNAMLTFAVTGGAKVIEFNLTPSQRGDLSQIYMNSKDLEESETSTILLQWNELVKESSGKREKRHILTENIVGAANLISPMNKLIRYNLAEGIIKNGILMARDYGKDGEDRFAFLPIKDAAKKIEALEPDQWFSDMKQSVKFTRVDHNHFKVSIPKSGNHELFTDSELRTLILRAEGQSEDELPDFVQNANDMVAGLNESKLQPFLDRLNQYGLMYVGESRPLEDWEIENENDWKKRTEHSGSFRYKLSRDYGHGSNPTISFIAYEEPTTEHPHGVVVYDRPLTDSEKYNYSLIPLFSSVEVPYQSWKAYIRESASKDELKTTLDRVADKRLPEAIYELGLFITNHPHEDGNLEFVFGEYTAVDLGRAAYEDLIFPISPLDELIEQLQIELHTT